MNEPNPIAEWMKGRPPPGPFKPHASYQRTGDFIEAYWSDAEAYAEQITPDLVLMRCFRTHAPVGVKVFGVKGKVDAGI